MKKIRWKEDTKRLTENDNILLRHCKLAWRVFTCSFQVFVALEKAIRTAQTHQIKYLQALEDKDKQEVMKKISNRRKDEFRKLSKKTKEKNELDRLKREVTNNLVELGVTEREKMDKIYQKFRLNLESSHQEILKKFAEKKYKVCET